MQMTSRSITRRDAIAIVSMGAAGGFCRAVKADTALIPAQPYFAGVSHALGIIEKLGAPVSARDAELISALAQSEDESAVLKADAVLHKYTLARLTLDGSGPARIETGGAERLLVEHGWRMFLVRFDNEGGVAHSIVFPRLNKSVSQLMPGVGVLAQRPFLPDTTNAAPLVEQVWLQAEMFGATEVRVDPFKVPVVALSGFPREYHVIQLFSRNRGARTAQLALRKAKTFWYGGAFKEFDFQCLAAKDVKLRVRDSDGVGCMGAMTIRDAQGRIYPPQAMRLAPDMSFHAHIYRADGETIRLPDGEYTVESSRGPEYLRGSQTVRIDRNTDSIDIQLRRWIDPSRWGWFSGDTHIHAAGCAHYQVPTEGVTPETIIRHVRGEALVIGEVLTWGPSWYFQKQFFSASATSPRSDLEHPELQSANNVTWTPQPTPKDGESLLRYDVEVSGFPSSISGHLMLLRLREQDYPGTKTIEDWPSWSLPILTWARNQGAVVGFAHCAFGMEVDSQELPNFKIPPFDSVGTNEAIVDVTHGAVDFLAGCNLYPVAELNAWYHMLNCGFRLAFVGETDYPCVSGERPGVGRTYVQLAKRPQDDSGYQEWVTGLRDGRVYCGDGRSHLVEFRVDERRSGEEVSIKQGTSVRVRATVAAWLDVSKPEDGARAIEGRWHLENARIAGTRQVPVELVVNGEPIRRAVIEADGAAHSLQFDIELLRSSWIALRIMASSHTGPVFVHVDDLPIRASKLSAEWCRRCVDKLWEVKSPFIRASEREAASRAYDHARAVYDLILRESA